MIPLESIIQAQKTFFDSGKTKEIPFRLNHLKTLKKNLNAHEQEIVSALQKDLGKGDFEAYTSEIGLVYHEISTFVKNLGRWAKTKKTRSPFYLFPSKSYIQHIPYGQTLIIAPFNFPVQLTLLPLIGSIGAGNTAVIKPSNKTPETNKILGKIISKTFEEGYVRMVDASLETSRFLLQKRWDLIFFTGSTKVGKLVAEAAAKHLTPVILELGGKNPVIVDKDARLQNASKKITWGKLLNAGQSCVSPDTLYVHSEVKEEFVSLLKKDFANFVANTPHDYPKIVDTENVLRLEALIKDENIAFGGGANHKNRTFEPTLVVDASPGSLITKEEIFGPVLSIQAFDNLDGLIAQLKTKEKPLALYYFSENRKNQMKVLKELPSGGAGLNELVLHFVNNHLPFGGMGNSGLGKYHGKHSFEAFSHTRAMVKSSTWFDLPVRYAPYKKLHNKLLHFLIK